MSHANIYIFAYILRMYVRIRLYLSLKILDVFETIRNLPIEPIYPMFTLAVYRGVKDHGIKMQVIFIGVQLYKKKKSPNENKLQIHKYTGIYIYTYILKQKTSGVVYFFDSNHHRTIPSSSNLPVSFFSNSNLFSLNFSTVFETDIGPMVPNYMKYVPFRNKHCTASQLPTTLHCFSNTI